ncbi:MAG TPA: tetratricopeptide repeat protein [Thermoanaerobaculia bacterium]|nr:tetratricopeptide repeat protein [Thermoanaerobaculia bacterium]
MHVLALIVVLADVQSVSDAERAAVQIAADYLSRGPAAVAEQLAVTSPLRKLAPAEQLADLEVRLGPYRGAQWELKTATRKGFAVFAVTYPAGFEDHIAFDLVNEGGAFKVGDVRFLALAAENAATPHPPSAPSPLVEGRRLPIALPVVAAALVAMLVTATLIQAMRHKRVRALIGVTVAMAIIGAVLIIGDVRLRSRKVNMASVAPKASAGPVSLASLLPMRRALCEGTGDVAAAYRSVDRTSGRGAIADLWKIEADLLQTSAAPAKSALANFRMPYDRPLAELLRGRLALLENDAVTAALAFENAMQLSAGSDALLFENAELLYSLGFEDRAKEYYEKLAALGSREADVYYALSAIAAEAMKDEDAEKYLRRAWAMRPVERAQLMGTGSFWAMVRRPGVAQLIGFSAPSERLVASPNTGKRAIRLPAGAESRTSGEYLQIAIGEQQLRIPGGAELAPIGTPAVEATVWAEAERERRLSDLQALLAVGTNAAAYAQPALRERISGTAEVLATRNRWADLVKLTEGLSPAAEHVPPSIFFLRSVGLQRVQRGPEARQLLTQVATSRVLQRRRDANELMQLAELFSGHDLFDASVKMYDRAARIEPSTAIDDRVRQIRMNQRLATSYSTRRTPHFEIHFPPDVSIAGAERLGQILEDEFRRLQSWIPVSNMPMVVVNVVWWQEFRSTYTGSDYILGFYNGKITLPFAGVDVRSEIIPILAHELAHAMIAHATADQAPRWFHEGFAQRVQGSRYSANAFNMYDDDKLLPLALLDAVLSGSPDPEMIGAAYIVSQTDIRFIEAKLGRSGLHKMLAAFRAGATTEEAIREVFRKPMPEVERELREWGRSERRVFEN